MDKEHGFDHPCEKINNLSIPALQNTIVTRMGRRGGSILTYSGIEFFPLDPRREEINLVDVAHSLSLKTRFTGHTRVFYSVAEHAVRVSRFLEEQSCLSVMEQFVGLHHDDAEAFLPDVATPLKVMAEFEKYREIEHAIQKLCFEKFGCDDLKSGNGSRYKPIKEADVCTFLYEKEWLMASRSGDPPRRSDRTSDSGLFPMTSTQANLAFLERHICLAEKLLIEATRSVENVSLVSARAE